ncbi:MAG: VOC family protein [Bryobacteraceae bacterium]|nr:VOC family protein [Bryobacteraceae bacterium]
MQRPAYGSIGWVDLTVPDAPRLREFYEKVAGWESQPVKMSGYDDFSMVAESGEGVAGVCHARGGNANLPPVWMIYIIVESLDRALENCRKLGGEAVTPIRMAGGSRYAVIKDPAGAFCALWEPDEAA